MDRGSFGVEVVLTLYALKLNYPKNVVMLRGNHESVQMTNFFNFKEECERKYGVELYNILIESFYCLPLACILNKKFLALHGGHSPDLKTVSSSLTRRSTISAPSTASKRPPRKVSYGTSNPLTSSDMLWSDPIDDDKGECDPAFKPNSVRSCSYYFG